jgi:hypothetical protein
MKSEVVPRESQNETGFVRTESWRNRVWMHARKIKTRASGGGAHGFSSQGDENQRRAEMKKIVFGALATAAVIASVSSASAQNRMDRNWQEISANVESSYEQPARRKGISYGNNLRFERADVGK